MCDSVFQLSLSTVLNIICRKRLKIIPKLIFVQGTILVSLHSKRACFFCLFFSSVGCLLLEGIVEVVWPYYTGCNFSSTSFHDAYGHIERKTQLNIQCVQILLSRFWGAFLKYTCKPISKKGLFRHLRPTMGEAYFLTLFGGF